MTRTFLKVGVLVLVLALGHVHATHRLWQMEVFRRVLQGRLSEIFGSRMVETDRFLRTIGLEEAAVQGLPPSHAPMHRYMEGYAQGVNEALAQWSGPLPPGVLEEAARAAGEFADLPWGEAHTLTLEHPLGGIPVLGSLFRFGRSGIPRVGGPYSVNVAGFDGIRPPFQTRYGPSQRHVVDMADPSGSGGFILPGGQSGYPANDHSFDQLTLWREGRLWLLPLHRRGTPERPGVEELAVAQVQLLPSSHEPGQPPSAH